MKSYRKTQERGTSPIPVFFYAVLTEDHPDDLL